MAPAQVGPQDHRHKIIVKRRDLAETVGPCATGPFRARAGRLREKRRRRFARRIMLSDDTDKLSDADTTEPTMPFRLLRDRRFAGTLLLSSLGALLMAAAVLLSEISAGSAIADEPQAAAAAQAAPQLEPKAIEILKAMSARLAAAHSLRFTAVSSYESPSRVGTPLVYMTTSDVTLKRPNKLQVITAGDGPASEFYYDGKTMVALAPGENLVAIAEAPPTIDAALEAAYHDAQIYFPFTDLIVADPYGDIAGQIELAFYIGQSKIVGGTTTDMVAFATHGVFVQVWIGAEDKLPRMARAIYHEDAAQLRQQVDFSHWLLDTNVDAVAFASPRAGTAGRIPFDRPDAPQPPGVVPLPLSGSEKSSGAEKSK
jgi:hypothetical protein